MPDTFSEQDALHALWSWLTQNGVVAASAANAPVTVSGTVTTALSTSAAATLTSVAGSVTTGVALASNANAKARLFVNDQTAGSTNNAYLAYAATATTSAYTVKIPANGFYETPRPIVYTGVVSVIFDSAAGNLRVTEV